MLNSFWPEWNDHSFPAGMECHSTPRGKKYATGWGGAGQGGAGQEGAGQEGARQGSAGQGAQFQIINTTCLEK